MLPSSCSLNGFSFHLSFLKKEIPFSLLWLVVLVSVMLITEVTDFCSRYSSWAVSSCCQWEGLTLSECCPPPKPPHLQRQTTRVPSPELILYCPLTLTCILWHIHTCLHMCAHTAHKHTNKCNTFFKDMLIMIPSRLSALARIPGF